MNLHDLKPPSEMHFILKYLNHADRGLYEYRSPDGTTLEVHSLIRTHEPWYPTYNAPDARWAQRGRELP